MEVPLGIPYKSIRAMERPLVEIPRASWGPHGDPLLELGVPRIPAVGTHTVALLESVGFQCYD